jgi:hypothetical protein
MKEKLDKAFADNAKAQERLSVAIDDWTVSQEVLYNSIATILDLKLKETSK